MLKKINFLAIIFLLIIISTLFKISICFGESLILKQNPSEVYSDKGDGAMKTAHFFRPYVIRESINTYFRISDCLSENRSCGDEAANYFCKKNDYRKAVYWEVENCSVIGHAVLWVNQNRRCEGSNCFCFSIIDCQ